MEKDRCKYHPLKSPRWSCETCEVLFCGECIPGARINYPKNTPKCPLCHNPVSYLGSAYDADPFWKAAGKFFQYPLRPSGLIAMAAICGSIYLTLTLPTLFQIALALGIAASLTRYLMLIIEESSRGKDSPPDISAFFQADPNRLFLKLIAIFIITGSLTGLMAQASPTLAQIFLIVFGNILMPAVIMLLAISKSLLSSINPLNIVSLVMRVGLPYLLLTLCLMAVSLGPEYLLPLLASFLPPIVLAASMIIVGIYFMFVTFRMMGYTVYQYQGVLGFTSDDDEKFFLEEEEFRRKAVLAKAHVYTQEGRFEDTLKVLQEAINQDKSSLEYQELMHKLLIATNSVESVKQHAEELARLLIDKGFAIKAAGFFLEAENKGINILYQDSEICYQVAEALFEQSKYRSALKLLVGLHKRDPDYPGLYDAYFLAARAFIEGLQDDEKGGQLIGFIQKKFPDNPRYEEVNRYRQNLLA